jgi:membrane-associated phospholipid phosphatase
VGWVYGKHRNVPRLAHMAHAGCFIILFTNVAALFNYLVDALAPLPLWDQKFDALDRALGLNWLGLYNSAVAHSSFYAVCDIIYNLLGPELIILLLLLEGLGRHESAVALRHGFCISGLATIIIGLLMPAVGPFAYYHLPVAGQTAYVVQFAALRDGAMRVIDLSNAQGLISFPSFHTTLAVLCAYAARAVRVIFWPALVLNVLIIGTAPFNGGHYFVDVIAGFALAVVVIYLRQYAGLRLGWAAAPPRLRVG